MIKDFNKLVLQTIFPQYRIDGDFYSDNDNLKSKKIPDFFNDLNWADKALDVARKKFCTDYNSYVAMVTIKYDGYSFYATISDDECETHVLLDSSLDDFNTKASNVSLLALYVFSVKKDDALKELKK
jgi:hypothetical protein